MHSPFVERRTEWQIQGRAFPFEAAHAAHADHLPHRIGTVERRHEQAAAAAASHFSIMHTAQPSKYARKWRCNFAFISVTLLN